MSKGRAGFAGHLLTVVGFLVLFFGLIVFVLQQAGTLPTFGKKYQVTAELPTVNLLAQGARVTIGGAEVGQVKSVERGGDLSRTSKVVMELSDDRVFPLPTDSRVELRTRSQVGENYVSIAVGDAETTIPEGGTIGLGNAEEVVSVDQILSVLRGKTRERTRTLFKEFGGALAGRGQEFNETLRYAADFADYGTATVQTLAQDRDQLGLLVDQLGRVTAALGDRRAAIDTIAAQGTRTLEAIASRDTRVAEMLRELPPTLDQVRETSAVLGDVGDRATPVVSDLAKATSELQPAIAALAPSAAAGRQVVAALGDTVPELEYFLNGFPPITGHNPGGPTRNGLGIRAATTPIRNTFCQANPALRYLEPYTADLFQVVKHLGSGANSYDATGHMVRLTPIINENSLSGAPAEVTDAAHTLLSTGVFVPQKNIKYDPYMLPGEVGKVVASDKTADNMTEYGQEYEYQRVRAQCLT